jgi:uncharacterized protein
VTPTKATVPGGSSPKEAAATLDEKLQSFVGLSSGPGLLGADPVNLPMIRHWVEAMGDHNPVYVDNAAARDAGFSGIIAPPTMLQAWIMRGLRASQASDAARADGVAGESASDRLMAILDDAGFTSVVATNCDQHYARPLVPGDHLEVSSIIDAVSSEKATGLWVGHFITTRLEFTDQHGERVATMRFRILRFRPQAQKPVIDAPLRPRPALTQDIAFFFEGAKQGTLLIQRCGACGILRHPPRPACASCGSFDWDTVASSGRGTVYSFVVMHHPQIPGFDYPLPIAVVELEEGTRLVGDLIGVDPGDVRIGMPVVAEMVAVDDELTIPMFRPLSPEKAA